MVVYSTIHECMNTKDRGSELPGKKLYDGLADIIRSHCKDLRTVILRSNLEAADRDWAIMERYEREWKRHCRLAKLIAHNYRYMDRHWVQHERSNNVPGVYPIQELHSIIWREEVAIGNRIHPSQGDHDSDFILDIAVRLRKGEGSDPEEGLDQQASDLLREVFKNFEEIGIEIGTRHATAEDRMLRPEIVAQHETLRSRLKITARVPLAETWSGRVR